MKNPTAFDRDQASFWSWMRRSRTEPVLFWSCGLLLALTSLLTIVAGFNWIVSVARAQQAAGLPRSRQSAPPNFKANAAQDVNAAREELRKQFEAEQQETRQRLEFEQKEMQERVDKELEHSKQLLDGLVTLVGVYSVLLGITAFVTTKFTREEASERMEEFRKRSEAIEQDVKEEYQKRLSEFERSFPEFSQMDQRIRRLVREIELTMPSMDHWNDSGWFQKLKPADHVFIQNSETTVLALSVVVSVNQSPDLRAGLQTIYQNLARYYDERGGSASQSPEDFERSLFYASRVIEMSPESSAGYRQRGAFYLSRYNRFANSGQAVDSDEMKGLLKSAELSLAEAIKNGTDGSVDAGAYYNKALAEYFCGDIESAVALSRRLLSMESKIPGLERERYLPYVYQNLACYLADLAATAEQENRADDVNRLSREAVEAVSAGIEDFIHTERLDRGLERLKNGVRDELRPGGDLMKLGQPYRTEIEGLLKKKSKDGENRAG